MPTAPTSATLVLSSITFQPWSPGNYCTAQMALAAPVSGFSLHGETLTVSTAAGVATTLVFQLPDPGYVLLGVAFNPDLAGTPKGRQEFPLVAISRALPMSQLTLTDAGLGLFNGQAFNYVIIIQQISSGAIGLIDPVIINEPET
ncbi:MAG: hypothetical protein Q8J74_13070 [Candidatus Didemnitutus sp.]|nr:hypothetical protein [Candidatus Didemnitutus sp.]